LRAPARIFQEGQQVGQFLFAQLLAQPCGITLTVLGRILAISARAMYELLKDIQPGERGVQTYADIGGVRVCRRLIRTTMVKDRAFPTKISDREPSRLAARTRGNPSHEPSSTIAVSACCAQGPNAVRVVAALPRCVH